MNCMPMKNLSEPSVRAWRDKAGVATDSLTRARAWVSSDCVRLWYVLAAVVFVVLSLLGVTTSSLGISSLRFDASASEGTLGEPLAIRSDEWMRNTPMRLGVMRTGTDDFMTPLGSGPELLVGLQRGASARLVFFDASLAKLGPVLPDRQLFAFLWWLPFYIIALSVPFILRFLGVATWIAIATTCLVLLSPVMAWWSLVAPAYTAWTFACAAFLLLSYHLFTAETRHGWKRIAGGAAALLGAAAMAARMALSYPPWTIPLGLLLVLPVAVALVFSPSPRRKYVVWGLAAFLVLTAGIIGEVVIANREAYESLLATTYPGDRRVGGGGVGLAFFLSGFFAAGELAQREEVAIFNQSETATGYMILTLALLLTPSVVRSRPAPRTRSFMLAAASMTLLLTLWAVAPWPGWSQGIPLLNLAPPVRVSQIIGVGCLCLFATLVDSAVRSILLKPSTANWVALSIFVVLMIVGIDLRGSHLPDLTLWEMGAIALIVSVSMWLLLRRGLGPIGAALLVGLSAIGFWFAGPLQFGLGDLRGPTFDSTISQLEQVAGDGLVVSDDFRVNALTEAGGLPSLSGEQIAPSDTWRVLDPAAEEEQAWNRAALILFQWVPDSDIVIEALYTDVIRVTAPPCISEWRDLGVTAIVSSRELTGECLDLSGTFTWGEATRYIYALRDLPTDGGA